MGAVINLWWKCIAQYCLEEETGGMMDDNNREHRHSRLWGLLRWPLIILGVLLTLVVAAAIVLPYVFPPQQLKALIVPQIESAVGREVEVEEVQLRVLPLPTFRMMGFEIANAKGFGEEPALEGKALDIRLKPFPLLQGEVRLGRVELIEPVVRYEVNQDGTSNFADLGGSDTTEAAPLAVAVSDFAAENATVLYLDQSANQRAELRFNMQVDAASNPEEGTLSSHGTVEVAAVKWLAVDTTAAADPLLLQDISVVYEVRVEPEKGRLALDRLEVVFGSSTVRASGTVETSGDQSVADLRLATEAADLADLAAVMGTGQEAGSVGGEVSFELQVVGPAASPSELALEGPVRLSDVRYPVASFREPVRIPSAELRFANKRINIEQLPIYLGEDQLLLDLEVHRPMAMMQEETKQPAASATFELTSERLDLTTLYAETDASELSYSDLFVARLAGMEMEGADPGTLAAERYGSMPLPPMEARGTVRIGELVNPPSSMRDLVFQVRLANQKFELHGLSAQMYGGQLSGQMTVGMGEGGPPYPMSYNFALNDGKAAAFTDQWTALGPVVAGTLDFSLSGQTALDQGLLPVAETIEADGQAVASKGQFQKFAPMQAIVQKLQVDAPALNAFNRFGGPFEIRQGQLIVGGWELGTDQINGQVDGSLGLGGGLDLKLSAQMPLSLVQDSRLMEIAGGNVGQLLNRIANEDEVIPVQIGLGGVMSNPVVRVDTEAFTTEIRERAKETGKDVLKDLFDR